MPPSCPPIRQHGEEKSLQSFVQEDVSEGGGGAPFMPTITILIALMLFLVGTGRGRGGSEQQEEAGSPVSIAWPHLDSHAAEFICFFNVTFSLPVHTHTHTRSDSCFSVQV